MTGVDVEHTKTPEKPCDHCALISQGWARVRGEVNAYSEIIPAVALADLRAALEGEQQ